MWIVLGIILVALIVFFIKKLSNEAEQKRLEAEKAEKAKKVAAEAKAKKEKYGVLTDSEKQRLKELGSDDYSTTLKAYEKALKGNAESMAFMGYTYRLNLKSPSKSFYWIERASNAGYLDAQYWLGEYYMNGYGVKENRIRGTRLILEAAKKGNKEAIKSLEEEFHMSKSEMRANGIRI